jgi:hypothetical protein
MIQTGDHEQPIGPHRGRIASFVGLVMSAYFALEADGMVPNILGARSRLVAGIFAENDAAHFASLSDSSLRTFGFAAALCASVLGASRNARPPMVLRLGYGLGALAFPTITLVVVIAQPFVFGEFCIPCLLATLVAIAMLEFKQTAIQDLAIVGEWISTRVTRKRGPSGSSSLLS